MYIDLNCLYLFIGEAEIYQIAVIMSDLIMLGSFRVNYLLSYDFIPF